MVYMRYDFGCSFLVDEKNKAEFVLKMSSFDWLKFVNIFINDFKLPIDSIGSPFVEKIGEVEGEDFLTIEEK